MELKRAHEVAETCRQWEKSDNWHNTPEMQATIVLSDRVTELEAQHDELLAMCKKTIALQPKALSKMEKNNIVLDDLSNIYQKLAFTFYSTIAEHAGEVERMIADWDEIKQSGVAD